jgi:hypothetical protein
VRRHSRSTTHLINQLVVPDRPRDLLHLHFGVGVDKMLPVKLGEALLSYRMYQDWQGVSACHHASSQHLNPVKPKGKDRPLPPIIVGMWLTYGSIGGCTIVAIVFSTDCNRSTLERENHSSR